MGKHTPGSLITRQTEASHSTHGPKGSVRMNRTGVTVKSRSAEQLPGFLWRRSRVRWGSPCRCLPCAVSSPLTTRDCGCVRRKTLHLAEEDSRVLQDVGVWGGCWGPAARATVPLNAHPPLGKHSVTGGARCCQGCEVWNRGRALRSQFWW